MSINLIYLKIINIKNYLINKKFYIFYFILINFKYNNKVNDLFKFLNKILFISLIMSINLI